MDTQSSSRRAFKLSTGTRSRWRLETAQKWVRQILTCCRWGTSVWNKEERKWRERGHARHAAQTASESQATSQWKSTREHGAESPEVQQYGTLNEAMKQWRNNLERLDSTILEEHHVTRKLLIWVNPCFHPTLVIILSHFTYGCCHLHVPC